MKSLGHYSLMMLLPLWSCSVLLATSSYMIAVVEAFVTRPGTTFLGRPFVSTTTTRTSLTHTALFLSDWKDNQNIDSNLWRSSDDDDDDDFASSANDNNSEDWQSILQRKQDGSYWSDFVPSSDDDQDVLEAVNSTSKRQAQLLDEDEAADAWLDTLASLGAEEVEFNLKEADRADKVRQMEEWGFDAQTISNTLDVAISDLLDTEELQSFRQTAYEDDEVDLRTVESHSRVETDEETGEPVRSQMVYVDEHTCIGCTNCAMIAPSTFFMHDEHGRARVFEQWGDDDQTIQIAIETCPVDCIHYVPYEELVKLEIERRDQNINFKARLVSQAEYGGVGGSHMVGGSNGFTAPQQISGNMGSRCNNCPSRGCKTCPMYGVGKNPEFQRKEKARKERMAKKRLQEERERQNKSAEL